MENEIKKIMDEQFQKEKALKVERYRRLNQFARKGQILFVGSSLMEQFPIDEMQRQIDIPLEIYNRGIGGYVTTELLQNIDACILELEPKYIFINIGTNDISGPEYNKEELLDNYGKILDIVKEKLPDTKVTLLSYYPTNPEFGEKLPYMKEVLGYRSNARIKQANEDVKAFAEERGLEWIYVNDGLMDEKGYLKEEFAIDGMHFFANGYKVILENMLPILKELR
ncbi:GDSL-type esterase/lipase family protein [Butyrivibrio sp. JL13D10]|uniref:GDSL-type esterase/lipase family protein n=1 Tax=Butyrivibrio sp. JL13D10 TaxID=3236815 RepID=UPI0038B60ABC